MQLLTLTLARDELMFSMFSMLPMQLFGTLLQAKRMKSQKLRWPSNQLPAPVAASSKTLHFLNALIGFLCCQCKEERFIFTFKAVAEDVLKDGGEVDKLL